MKHLSSFVPRYHGKLFQKVVSLWQERLLHARALTGAFRHPPTSASAPVDLSILSAFIGQYAAARSRTRLGLRQSLGGNMGHPTGGKSNGEKMSNKETTWERNRWLGSQPMK
jgi:hypothetical protein